MSVLFHQQGGGTNGHFAWIRIRLFFFIWIRILKTFQKNSITTAFEKIQMFSVLKSIYISVWQNFLMEQYIFSSLTFQFFLLFNIKNKKGFRLTGKIIEIRPDLVPFSPLPHLNPKYHQPSCISAWCSTGQSPENPCQLIGRVQRKLVDSLTIFALLRLIVKSFLVVAKLAPEA